VSPSPAWPASWAGDVVLADGGTAHVRPIRPEDAPLLAAFHARLSPESIYLRFFSPRPQLSLREIDHFTKVDYDARVALVVLLGEALIGVGRYDRLGRSEVAEVAFVVDDAQQGRGIASLLLERLATAARRRGLQRFTADVLPHNRAMLHVFHNAGFDVTSRFEDGVVRLSFPIQRTARARELTVGRERLAEARSIDRLLSPRGIGVIAEGEAAEPIVQALRRSLEAGGFEGPVRRLSAFAPSGDPSGLDLVFIAVPPDLLPAQIERCGDWGVHGAVLLATGAPDDEAAVARGDRALAARARRDGLRLLGPASLGLARSTAASGTTALISPAPVAPGGLALFTESPQRGREALEVAAAHGLALSTFISAGRKADVSASDCLQFWGDDEATRVIALAVRSLGNPRRSAPIVSRVARRKPVLVWVADLPDAAASEFVPALLARTGVIACASLEDMLALAATLLTPKSGHRHDAVSARIDAWEAWRLTPPERFKRAEGVDAVAARCLVDTILGASPAGAAPAAEEVALLLGSYGVAIARSEAQDDGQARLRVRQEPAWGSILAIDAACGASRARLVPLTNADARTLAASAPRAIRAERLALVRRIATLAADVPELASLGLALPTEVGALPALVRGSARLAPWTLGPGR
jgi:RimJ/RimL family protein N-acetyltransferase/succinyl-CoA synthetase alpha subunit